MFQMDGILEFNTFLLLHKQQLTLSGVPEHFWPPLCKKLRGQIFDSNIAFQLCKIDYGDEEKKPYDPLWTVVAIKKIERDNPFNIFLVDHAWTFKANRVKIGLESNPDLLDMMCKIMQIEGDSRDELIEKAAEGIWKYAHTYALSGEQFGAEDRTPVWYVHDLLGSGIIHSERPNFRVVPFILLPERTTFTLIFPIEDIEDGDQVLRNYVEGSYPDPLQREALLIPWKHYDHFYDDFTQIEPDRKYFIEHHIRESLPDLNMLRGRKRPNRKLKVYSNYELIRESLTSLEFEFVEDEFDADILWYLNHYFTYHEFSRDSPNKFVNQFPYEYVITIKDLLAIVARRCNNKSADCNPLEIPPAWLPVTFNMKTELPKLVSYYMQRKKAGLDNYWICKPFNLARGLDTHITNNLNFLCRLPLSGPKIAQKYIEDPVLFERPDVGLVKFDIRYVVLLKSVDPTEVYIYNNFFLRFANKPFAMNNFEDYEQHYTVMNYIPGVNLHRVLCADFKEEWSKQYNEHSWADVEKSILKMFAEFFSAAASKPPPCGIGKSPQSRALYAADIMLAWDKQNKENFVQPKLLEMNWMPDCRRACEYYPEFFNDIFSVLFLDKEVETCTKVM